MSKDSELQQAILAEFEWEPSVTAAHIGVTARDGVVTLSGHVNSYVSKLAAETAARRVKGVKAVAEEIEVRLPCHATRTDDEIAAAALDRLAWNVSIPRDRITVMVEKGWVTLTGQVDFWYEKDAAEQDVRPLMGVVGVSNLATILPHVDAANLHEDIALALHRSSFSEPDQIHVSAKGGHVWLTGSVHSFHERLLAGVTAWSAPGATMVENELSII